MTIDLNCDLGEGAGNDDALLQLVTSANIACGVHAGDLAMMTQAVKMAEKRGVAVGAHPGLPDKDGFGRRESTATPVEVYQLTQAQLTTLVAVANKLAHVKPHGALYHLCERDETCASAFVQAMREFDAALKIYAFAGGQLMRVAIQNGLHAVGEGFADRRYLPNGALTPRSEPNALLTNIEDAARQAVALAAAPNVGTLCVHGDSPDAVPIAAAVRRALTERGFVLAAPS